MFLFYLKQVIWKKSVIFYLHNTSLKLKCNANTPKYENEAFIFYAYQILLTNFSFCDTPQFSLQMKYF